MTTSLNSFATSCQMSQDSLANNLAGQSSLQIVKVHSQKLPESLGQRVLSLTDNFGYNIVTYETSFQFYLLFYTFADLVNSSTGIQASFLFIEFFINKTKFTILYNIDIEGW